MRHRLRWTLVLAAVLGLTWVGGGLPRLWESALSAPMPEENEVLAKMARLLGRDMIAPIYAPRFADAAHAMLRDDELILGVEINGEAKAYPITVLNAREMVNDVLGGVPILATW